ncbi:Protein SYS1 [Zostera marina]|uniref:Protein SYS1 n=1 Tax=Zostera marina TaxID=29655 RepID=A0A0K9PTS0_ZOSMR|nr:Protein SYS1 [Zostera marina]
MFYGAMVWDPWLIVSQILCLQCSYYVSLGIFMSILVGNRVSQLNLIYLFDYSALTISTVTGWCVLASFILSSLVGAGFLLLIIDRASKCLDFAATLYIVHLFICIVYGGWPSSITWWVVTGTGLALMALFGEWLCIRRDMQDIPITRLRSSV